MPYKSLYLPIFYLSLITLASVILFLPILSWFVAKMLLIKGYLHILMMLAILGLGFYRFSKIQHPVIHTPVLIHPALLVWIPACIFYLINEASLGFHTLSAILFLLYVYGISGHFLAKSHWQAILLPVLLIILVLPFEHYLDVYLGFPLRLLSAKCVATLLQFYQPQIISLESILSVDNKAAIVDLECSGIKSLWVGLIFYLLLTWVEKYRIGLRWLGLAGVFIGLLVFANVGRIIILVWLDLLLNQTNLAALLHQSLGLLGFIFSSLIIWFLLHYFVPKNSQTLKNTPNEVSFSQGILGTIFIISVILSAIHHYQPLQKNTTAITQIQIQLPIKYHLSPLKLKPQETDFFNSNSSTAQKYTFEIHAHHKIIKASMVLVSSRQWRAQHIPENCYLSQGYTIINKGVWTLTPPFNLRYLTLSTSTQNASKLFTGVYWFQSKHRTTVDYSARVLDALFNPNQQWLMVSILWQTPINPTIIAPFIRQLQMELSNAN